MDAIELVQRYVLGERDFSGARMQMRLRGAILPNLKLVGAHMNVDMSCAKLPHSDLSSARIEHSALEEADLHSVILRMAVVSQLNANGVRLDWADLSGAQLSGVLLRRANLAGAKLSNASIDRSDLTSAHLSEADCCEVTLQSVVAAKAYLTNTQLVRARMSDVVLDHACARQADLRKAHLVRVSLRHADLSLANFTGAILEELDCAHANLTGAKGLAFADAPSALKLRCMLAEKLQENPQLYDACTTHSSDSLSRLICKIAGKRDDTRPESTATRLLWHDDWKMPPLDGSASLDELIAALLAHVPDKPAPHKAARELCEKIRKKSIPSARLSKGLSTVDKLTVALRTADARLQNLRLLLEHKSGISIDWEKLHEDIQQNTIKSPLNEVIGVRADKLASLIADLIIHKDLLPHVESLRAKAPGRSDSAAAQALDRESS